MLSNVTCFVLIDALAKKKFANSNSKMVGNQLYLDFMRFVMLIYDQKIKR